MRILLCFFFFKLCSLAGHIVRRLRRRMAASGVSFEAGQERMPSTESARPFDRMRLCFVPVASVYICELLCVCYQGNILSGAAVLFWMNVMEHAICKYARRAESAEKNVRLLWKQKEIYRRYLDIMRKEGEKHRKLRHDLKKQYLLERMYLERGEYDMLQQEYDRVSAIVISKEVITGHVMLDAILTYERTEAGRRQIELCMEMSVPSELSVSDYHLNALLGNILDNAVQHTQTGGRIWIKMVYDRKNLFIKCRNAPRTLSGRRPLGPDEKEHGLGLQIVRDVVACYHGSMEIKKTTFEYAVIIILELSCQKLR